MANGDDDMVEVRLVFGATGDDHRRRILINSYIESLRLSNKAEHLLEGQNIRWVWELITKTELELLKIPAFGQLTLKHVKERLAEHELHLGMTVISRGDIKSKNFGGIIGELIGA